MVLDLACGQGRHARFLAERGYPVLAVDRDGEALATMSDVPGIVTCCVDLEGPAWPLAGEVFAGIVVTNYLWRPRLDDMLAALLPGGVLIYETFMVGNARFGKPANPDFLLQPGELLQVAQRHGLEIIASAEGEVDQPKPAVTQRLTARRPVAA